MTKGNSSKWMVLCALLLVGWSTTARAAEGHDFSVYARAVEFCRGAVHRPMAVDLDRRVLCLDGDLTLELDLKLAGELEPNGLFVVRSRGGYINRAAELAEALSDRNATVVVYDYCFSACASYLAMATPKTFVMKDTVLAWHHPPIYGGARCWCPRSMVGRSVWKMRRAPMRPVTSTKTKTSAFPTTVVSTAKGQIRPSKILLKAGSFARG